MRYTGKPANLPVGLNVAKEGVRITFSNEVDADSASDPSKYAVKTWSLKRTANYGSRHYDERPSKVTGVTVSADRRSVLLEIEDLKPTWCMEIRYSIRNSAGKSFNGTIHNTIHHLGN